MADLESIGDAVTGGVVGRAVEPRSGEAGDGHTHEKACLNCGAQLEGPYCHECGQRAHVHRTLSAFGHDLIHGVLHFEGKFWHTLPLLVWRPGELTRRYIDGQRARFISPIALFLFCVFVTFAIMGMLGTLDETARQATGSETIESEIADAKSDIADLEKDRAEAVQEKRPTAKIDENLTEKRAELTALTAVQNKTVKPGDMQIPGNMPGWLRDAAGRASANPELLFYKIKTNAYKFSWALIPISVPFVWLLFPFSRRFRLYDHTVFVTYSLCFMMLLLIVATSVALVLPVIAAFAWFVPPFHMYRQLRGTYDVGKFGAIWRTVALTMFAFIAIGLFASLLVGIGAFD
jgi:hypothetical protein